MLALSCVHFTGKSGLSSASLLCRVVSSGRATPFIIRHKGPDGLWGSGILHSNGFGVISRPKLRSKLPRVVTAVCTLLETEARPEADVDVAVCARYLEGPFSS